MKKNIKLLIILSTLLTATTSYAFTPLPFVKSTNIYEVNVRQYTPEGTFKAFAKHLPRLKEMGVKTLWFMPIQPIGSINRKGSLGSYYSIKNYKEINSEFGNLQDFKNVVNEAHSLGIKVIIDWVANHTAWDNPWVAEHPEYYHKDSNGKMHSPYDWADVVQVDTASEALHNAHIEAMQYWVKAANIDGFRCDVANFLPVHFWVKARKAVDAIKPLMWLGECGEQEYFQAFDILYGWEWLHKMKDVYEGKATVASLDTIMQKYYEDYKRDKYRIIFTSNHDENSWSGSEYERLGKSAQSFATACATLPAIPLVYSGQEGAFNKRLRFFEKDTIQFNAFSLNTFYKKILSGTKSFSMTTQNVFEESQHPFLVYPNKEKIGSYYVINLSGESARYSYLKSGKALAKLNEVVKTNKKIKHVTLESWSIKLIE